jgi:hypothetical protein
MGVGKEDIVEPFVNEGLDSQYGAAPFEVERG